MMNMFSDEYISENKEYFDFLIRDNLKILGLSLAYSLTFWVALNILTHLYA